MPPSPSNIQPNPPKAGDADVSVQKEEMQNGVTVYEFCRAPPRKRFSVNYSHERGDHSKVRF